MITEIVLFYLLPMYLIKKIISYFLYSFHKKPNLKIKKFS